MKAFEEAVGGRGCVLRGGSAVHAWGQQDRRADVASAAKPVYAHFLFQAVEEGKLAGVDEPVLPFEPRLGDLNASLGHKDRKIRWSHLATQTSCYGVAEEPGQAFDYSDHNMALLFDILFRGVYGASLETVDSRVLGPRLAEVLGFQDRPTFLAFGAGDRPGRLGISLRDFARFGLLYLQGGDWNGRRVLRKSTVERILGSALPNALPRTEGKPAEMIPGQRSIGGGKNQTDHLGSYSFAWWTNGVDRSGERHWPDAPHDAFGAFGHAGKRALVIIPSLDAVATWNDSRIESRREENLALKLLKEGLGGR